MEVVTAIVGPVVNLLTVHITQKLRYLTSYAEHVERMKNRMKVLEDLSADIERLKRQHPNMPAHVPVWLEDVKKIKEDVDNIPSNNFGCFSVKKKFLAGKNALRLTKVIEGLIGDGSKMISDETLLWREAKGCLGRVDSQNQASTSTSGVSVFDSRLKAFSDALKLLQQDDDHTARVIALCGMGGVGKTTLMKQLKEAAEDNKMFNWIAVVTVGKSSNLFAIQNAIAEHIGTSLTKSDENLKPLTETDEKLRAAYLSKRFKELLKDGKKILVILDDVWEKIKLEDIGLASPLPNGVKLLLTSRDVQVCQQIADNAALEEVKVDVLKENEAQDFFCQKAGISAEHDRDLYEIGREIVKKCGCLPLAIELIAGTLKGEENRNVWKHSLNCLKNNDLKKNVQEIMEMSYNNLKQEQDKAIFLLCGLFPEDSNIPIEDLTIYAWGLKDAWGLKLLNKVYTIEAARYSTQTSVRNLKKAYLLMDGDSHHSDCVKLHDLVLSFVVATVSKGGEEECWIIHHEDDFSNWSEANSMSQPCKQISLACKGMSEFPSEFQYPNLSLLKLMHGNESLRFPPGFYEGLKQLQVIAFEKLEYPFVPTSVQFSADLRTLCLHECSLTFDLACIGNLSNLEVLSFANSGITILPSTFGKLKKLRLLDVTGCYKLVIDDGVLKSLEKLEELYMRSFERHEICFTDNNRSELAERSKNLHALEFEFIGDNAHMNNMSYENLKRFKLSVGCSFTEVRDHLQTDQVDKHSYENSLKLVTNKELLKSNVNELFKITDALYLQVNDMTTLEDVDVESPHPPQNSSFYNLRVLVVSECAKLTYLFTPSVAKNLSKLEYLDISGCPIMEVLIHTENDGSDIIKFSNLKYLRLADLPKLLHLCSNVDVIELPRLMELQLEGLPKITSIYPNSTTSFVSTDISPTQSLFNKEVCSSSLRSIVVEECESLVNLLPRNPMPLFNHLEELHVRKCAFIEVIFDIDMGCVGEMDKVSNSRLRSIFLRDLGKLREVWRIKDAGNNSIHGFEAVESIYIGYCERFENLITPATTNLDMRALKLVDIRNCSKESERKNELVEKEKEISKIAFPLPTFNHLHKLQLLWNCCYDDVEVVFEITSPISRESPHNTQQQLIILPNLEYLELGGLEKMSHVWKCNWNELILQKQPSQSSFHNLTTISMWRCNSIKYLFSPLMAKLLSSLKEIYTSSCDAIEEVVSNRYDTSSCDGIEEIVSNTDDEDASINSHTTTTFFPHLDILSFYNLKIFKCIGGGANGISNDIHDQHKLPLASWSLCQYAREISIEDCDALSSVVPWYAVGQMQIDKKVVETQDINNKSDTDTGKSLPRLEYITMLKLPKLKILKIKGCNLLEHVFTFSILESLKQLEELMVMDCKEMEVIVTEENGEQTTASVVVGFPRLKSLKLGNLPKFVGFFLGKNEFRWPALEEVEIYGCPQITVFTYGQSTAQKLRFINTSLGKHSDEFGLNFHVTITSHQDRLPSYESTSSYRPTTMERLPWSYHNLIEADMNNNPRGGQTLFSSDEVSQLQKLETVRCMSCWDIEQIFDSQTDVEIPNLRQVVLQSLSSLKYIWKSKQGTVLKFPNLTRLSIHNCSSLEYVLTCPMVGSLLQLRELHISYCTSMKAIVKGEEESDSIVDAIVKFPCLKSLKLVDLDSLEGFCLGKEAFEFPSLDTLEIKGCSKMTSREICLLRTSLKGEEISRD